MNNWANLCRCCLSPNSVVSILDLRQSVNEKFLDITTIQVAVEDGLPQRLCQECFGVLNSAYQFRQQCIKMDKELKVQLKSLLAEKKAEEEKKAQESQTLIMDVDEKTKKSMRELEAIIKSEPNDSDDDYYYVLVIDEQDEEKTVTKIKLENEPTENVSQESFQQTEESNSNFENNVDSFLVSNPKVSINVPDTILENEEDGTEDYEDYDNNMEIEEIDDQQTHEQVLTEIEAAQEETETELTEVLTEDIMKDLPKSKNLIKILTGGSERTILLKSEEGIKYLTDSQLISTEGLSQEEVIFCEGDDSSQFQILKCDGSELVIEYADDSQIATVLQQEDGTFLCDCGEQFEDLADYEKHQYKHNPSGEHLCNLCGKGFETSEMLTGHMLLHSDSGLMVSCPFCNQLIKRNALTQHIKYGHNNKAQCLICLKTFANQNNLKRHMMIHSGIRDFECDICFKRFHQKITMQTHRLTHINPNHQFVCNQCDKSFENKAALTAHKESDECPKTKIVKVKEELMKTVKKEVTTNLGKLLGYACSLCNKMFSVESALEQHISTHMVDAAETSDSEKNVRGKNIKRFECCLCGKNCASQAMLIMHERVHTNERPFPCQLCSLRFKTKTHLRTHQLTHTREKKFGCSVCMKFFALKGNLVVHLRTHTGERPYVCSLCDDAFIDSKYLKKHKLKKHSIENVPWNQY